VRERERGRAYFWQLEYEGEYEGEIRPLFQKADDHVESKSEVTISTGANAKKIG